MRRLLPLLLTILSLLVDTSILSVLTGHWMAPCLTLCTVCVLGLLLGRTRGALYGLVGGVLLDVLVGYPVGMNIVLFTLSGYACGFAGRRFQRYLLTVLVTPFLCFLLLEITHIVYLLMAGRAFSGWDMLRTLGRMVNETVICQLMYLWFNRMLRPSWSRYTGR